MAVIVADIQRTASGDPIPQYYNPNAIPPSFESANGSAGAVDTNIKTICPLVPGTNSIGTVVLDGVEATGVTQLAGGSGSKGWVSGLFQKLLDINTKLAGILTSKIDQSTPGITNGVVINSSALPVGASTSAKQDTIIAKDFATQATLATLLAKIIVAPSTEVKQDSLVTILTAIKDTTGIKKITDALPAGSAIIGKVGIDQTTDSVTNRTVSKISQVVGENIVSVSSLPSASWTISQDSAVNTINTLTKTAVAGQKHYITSIEVVISGAVVGASDINILLKDGGTTTKWKQVIGTASARGTRIFADFAYPIQMSVNSALTLNIDLGGTGVITTANIAGFTV